MDEQMPENWQMQFCEFLRDFWNEMGRRFNEGDEQERIAILKSIWGSLLDTSDLSESPAQSGSTPAENQ